MGVSSKNNYCQRIQHQIRWVSNHLNPHSIFIWTTADGQLSLQARTADLGTFSVRESKFHRRIFPLAHRRYSAKDKYFLHFVWRTSNQLVSIALAIANARRACCSTNKFIPLSHPILSTSTIWDNDKIVSFYTYLYLSSIQNIWPDQSNHRILHHNNTTNTFYRITLQSTILQYTRISFH